jgi:ribonuclease E
MKECISLDRARIQIGRISSFGLLEMSRQRLRPGMLESTTQPCSLCHGTGSTRSDESLALQILRDLDKEGSVAKAKDLLLVKAPIQTANFLINNKRDHILVIEQRYQIKIQLNAEANLISPDYLIEKPFDDKRNKKSVDNHKSRNKKKDKENRTENIDSIEDKKTLTNFGNLSVKEDADEQKKRKRKRKRRHQKDMEVPTIEGQKTNQAEALLNETKNELTSSKNNESSTALTAEAILEQKENSATLANKEQEKKGKPRTRASAKKTIERLKSEDNKQIEKDDNSKDTKMGKKGWWDR